ncbi:MAG: HEAT repeat domain-containing protein [Nitrospirales bacterium]|nr:HEAT repeat domain-containing protein [Nitrospirales bacterium]
MTKRITIWSQTICWVVGAFFLAGAPLWAQDRGTSSFPVYLTQMPYEAPPPPESTGVEAKAPPETLTPQDHERLEALIPMLEGRQEFWAMGEFVFFGKHSIPYLVKALKMPVPRVRFNAVETLSMLNDPSAIPGLLEVAMNPDEESRIRSHALRVATRLDPNQVIPAIEVMVKDPNSTIRNTAVFESRRVPRKEVLPVIISAISDPEQYVSITARDSFWILTRFSGSIHDWEVSTPEDRKEWVKEWWAWWEENKDRLGVTPPSAEPPRAPADQNVS